MQAPRWLNAGIAGLALYSLLIISFGLQNIWGELQSIPPGLLLLTGLIGLLTQTLLFLRWELYLRWLRHPLPLKASAVIFTAGLAMLASPGRTGEGLRALWLKQRHGFANQIGVGITLTERLSDLASALLVLSWGLGLSAAPSLLVGLLVLLGGAALISHPQSLETLEHRLIEHHWMQRQQRLQRLSRGALHSMKQLRKLLQPTPLLVGTLLAAGVWLIEASVLQALFAALHQPFSWQQAAVVRTAMALGGVLSFLPGGLGTSEATAIGISLAYGASTEQALGATLLIRMGTLAIPCLLGWLVLQQQKQFKAASSP